ncbi:MAG: HAD family hydrolase [Bacteriovorax sp.]|nr:HAD family hydrolase [Bacteriovorax sp.]
MKNILTPGMIIFDHDGTLVNTNEPDFKLFSGIKELLVDLDQAGFEMSVWTARGHRSTLESLKTLQIASYFWEIYGHDDGLSKPHPAGLAKISEGFGKDKLLHIGDSVGDLEGAAAFGIDVIAACWNSTNQVETFKRKTSFLAMMPDDCRKIIAAKFNVNL